MKKSVLCVLCLFSVFASLATAQESAKAIYQDHWVPPLRMHREQSFGRGSVNNREISPIFEIVREVKHVHTSRVQRMSEAYFKAVATI